MKANVYNQKGETKGTVELPESIFGLAWNGDLVHQVVVSMLHNARIGIAKTKDRAEVSGTGKKPWRQKGTGRARHGSRRSPIWRTGGVTFGPGGENFARKINKKMRRKALFVLLSRKLSSGKVLFVDSLTFAEPKTKEAKEVLINLSKVKGFEEVGVKKSNAVCIYLPEKDVATMKSFANFGNVTVRGYENMNPLDVSRYGYIVIAEPEKAVAYLKEKEAVKVTA